MSAATADGRYEPSTFYDAAAETCVAQVLYTDGIMVITGRRRPASQFDAHLLLPELEAELRAELEGKQ